MDSGASNQHQNLRKQAQFPSNSMKDSNLIIPSPPTELITEILLRLPVKSLLKFRSVSKSCLSLISSPEFIKNHLRLSANNKEDTYHMLILDHYGTKWNFKECLMRSLFYDSVSEAFDLSHPFANDGTLVRMVGCFNGLICLADYSGCSLLWNPTTRIHKNLPDFRPRWKYNFSIYGFGYDELCDDYKVVGVFYNYGGSDGVKVKIYSLKSDSWTSVGYCYEETFVSSNENITLTGSGFFVNGKFHWDSVVGGLRFIDERKCKNIISFDLDNKKWERMEKPSYGVGETDLCVGMLGSDLCVFSDYKSTQISAWVMNEYRVKKSWIKKFTIRYPTDQVLYPPFFMSNKGEILMVFESTSVVYNLKEEAFRYPHVINCNDFHGAGMYVESLVCPFSTEVTEDPTKQRRKKPLINNRVTNNLQIIRSLGGFMNLTRGYMYLASFPFSILGAVFSYLFS